ncbi:permease for cytosine/purines, uracil, thiamine, allantoin-domain-containing protein [Zychaea mexicana]|uniref:permease for cytosine/purines, uracil, thiamine, allantoin-domain-containing protein n=1 Tax=Zychaea mexicana TaxID=64656 RepID=UPI0022FE1277|nr:permease for cytosine/purines, uracil, thiamine, allantoin-domain-containing protein [Zychaea mexicana]KAI9488256.1 permease for cytosine/purines, uracil, thiamine, allantoin-domain-containing protein [Zychaea mexicana]
MVKQVLSEECRPSVESQSGNESIDAFDKSSSHPKNKWFSLPEIDQQGITPIPEDERPHERITDNFTMWFSINSNWIAMSIGMLATQIYHIKFYEGLLCIIFGNMVSALPGAVFATFGARYGLRQSVIARYSYGMIPSSIVSAIIVLSYFGWGIVDIILAAQLLTAVQSHYGASADFPLWAGILVIIAVTLAIGVFGYSIVHLVERWTWLPLWIIFFIILGLSAPHMDLSAATSSSVQSDVGDIVSFFATIASTNPVWVQCAADLTSKQPATFNRYVIALLTYFGAVIPIILLEIFGFSLAISIAQPDQNPTWRAGYEANSAGGLASAILEPVAGFGKLCLAIMAFGMIVHVVPNNYGASLTMQALIPGLHKIPIWVLTILTAAIITIAAIAGAEHLAAILQGILPFQMYCMSPYIAILLIEHFVMRSGHYPIDIWNSRSELPIGLAATFSTVGGYAFAFLGANQSFFTGPIAQRIGEHYGEVDK